MQCHDEHDIRLGSDGVRVEVLDNNTWGTICNTNFDDRDALVTCGLFGYNDGIAVRHVEPGTGPIIISELKCSGVGACRVAAPASSATSFALWCCESHCTVCGVVSFRFVSFLFLSCACCVHAPHDAVAVGRAVAEPDYRDCASSPYWMVNPNCTHADDAGVKCLNRTSVRLVDESGNSDVTSGRLEVHHDGEWGTVCHASLPVIDALANTVCKQLGFFTGYPYLESRGDVVPRTGGRIWLVDPVCPLSGPCPLPFLLLCLHSRNPSVWSSLCVCLTAATSIDRCALSDWDSASCLHSQDIGVRCVTARIGDDGYRLEMYHNGTWGTVCGLSGNGGTFSNTDASVACEQLGFADGVVAPEDVVVPGSGAIWLDNLQCNGTESSLEECMSRSWLSTNSACTHAKDVGVTCSAATPMRLVDGTNDTNGRLEVFHQGAWGTVCGESLSLTSLRLICRKLGYSAGAQLAPGSFPEGAGRIWLSNITCDMEGTSCAHLLQALCLCFASPATGC